MSYNQAYCMLLATCTLMCCTCHIHTMLWISCTLPLLSQ